jgi:hypothetical protein
MADFSLKTLLSLRNLTPDAKTMILALDRTGNRPHTPEELGEALGFPLDHVIKVQRELSHRDLSQKFHGIPTAIKLMDGCPWVGVTARIGPTTIEPRPLPSFSPADQTPLAVAPADEEATKKPRVTRTTTKKED